jgi:hypothetical protein
MRNQLWEDLLLNRKRQAGRVDGLARPPLKAPWRS